MRSLALAGLLAGLAPSAPAAPEPKLQAITVRPGDTLWSLAQKYLKDPKRWNVVLRYNTLPTSDPTAALPGMTLRVPTEELKERFQAAILVHMERKVSFREAESPSWGAARREMELFEDWGLRTQEQSTARVKFYNGSLLALDPNSMALLKSPKKVDHELELKRGAIHTTTARVVTPSARIVPKGGDTKYTARILDDLSTRVQVYKGAADVSDVKGVKTVQVKAGFTTDVPLDRAPAAPTKMPNVDMSAAPEIGALGQGRGEAVVKLRGPAAPAAGDLSADLAKLSVGVPVAAYVVQTAKDDSFRTDVKETMVDSGDEIVLCNRGRGAGAYYVRVLIVDLLGERSRPSAAKPCRPGDDGAAQSLAFSERFEVIRPEADEVKVRASRYRIMGEASPNLTVLINGERVTKDSDGRFSTEVLLQAGPNNFRIEASDVRGNDKVVIRRVIYEP